jgi:FdhE protein
MTPSSSVRLRNLSADHPEWNPWLGVISQVLSAAADSTWDDFVPPVPDRVGPAPLLARASIVISGNFLTHWFERLFRTAALGGTGEMATLRLPRKSGVETIQVFRAALAQKAGKLEEMAVVCGGDSQAFRSVAELIPVPFLHACRRLWQVAPGDSWTEQYCSICGAWPVMAEIRGIERARFLRCGRCGQEWQVYGMHCPYCSMDDHEQLVSLVPQNHGTTRAVEACKRCRGYLKTLTTLQGEDPLGVMLQDLASVDLDIAALEHGYQRPQGAGFPVDPTVGSSNSTGKRILTWGEW